MSWETFVVGSFELNEGILDNAKEGIIAELEEVLEALVTWDGKYQEYHFEDVNWTSHVCGDEIKEAVEKNRKFFKRFECSLYYLSEADEQINLEPNSDEVEAIIL
jgi:hypothetical protein